MRRVNAVGLRKRLKVNTLEIEVSDCKEDSIRFQDRLTAAFIVVVLLFTVAVIVKIAKKEINPVEVKQVSQQGESNE